MTSTMISPERVEEIYRDCMLKDEEDADNHFEVRGAFITIWFHPDRLREHSEEITSLLEEMPDTFKSSGGGGASLTEGRIDRHKNRWADDLVIVDKLLQLGGGIGKVREVQPVGGDDIPTPKGNHHYVID